MPLLYFSYPPDLPPLDAVCIAMNLNGSCSTILPIDFAILITIEAGSFT